MGQIQVNIIRCDRKSIAIRITGQDTVEVRAPRLLSDAEIQSAVRKKLPWITKKLNALAAQGTPEKLTDEEIAVLRQKAQAVIPDKVRRAAAAMGVTYGTVTIRMQKTRWGSCTSEGNLSFNCLLMLCPEYVVDYVVVHELCHRRYMNHSARFKSEIDRYYPYRIQAEKWQKEKGGAIIRRAFD